MYTCVVRSNRMKIRCFVVLQHAFERIDVQTMLICLLRFFPMRRPPSCTACFAECGFRATKIDGLRVPRFSVSASENKAACIIGLRSNRARPATAASRDGADGQAIKNHERARRRRRTQLATNRKRRLKLADLRSIVLAPVPLPTELRTPVSTSSDWFSCGVRIHSWHADKTKQEDGKIPLLARMTRID